MTSPATRHRAERKAASLLDLEGRCNFETMGASRAVATITVTVVTSATVSGHRGSCGRCQATSSATTCANFKS